ncbi:ATP-binding SpoIIE family protein phosphatase [Aquabacterium sp.]|uniref:ATP-binding SpoIIE family protein phosphatase n=1 Tax=Aquabacterium sp. TaxID=1872578 RepID=UPI002489C6E6|nr:ATP-binding SpoIIE family protein phosphatase [Aquabacterium sp.]MDI1259119.1 ATP-binding protein/SpoIIE family protein phosphatase [Aquabacterium sp.]
MLEVPCHLAIDVHDASQVGHARRAAVRVAEQLGFDEVATGRAALVATELGTNLVRHAQKGRLLVGAVEGDDGQAMVEILSLDHGPGIPNVRACMADGYPTGDTPGSGLGAVRRLSTEFDLFSSQPAGTVIMSRVAAKVDAGETPLVPANPSSFVQGSVALAAPGEFVCGDAWAVVQQGSQASIIVADGLGHGPLAFEASNAAVTVFKDAPFIPPSQAVERMHQMLRATRGAAVLMAQLNMDDNVLTFSGAGNIAGRLISGVRDKSLASQHGTVGIQIRRLQDVKQEWPPYALLVLHSDGLTTRWDLDNAQGILQHHPTVVAGWLVREHCRGLDDATVVVLKRRGA